MYVNNTPIFVARLHLRKTTLRPSSYYTWSVLKLELEPRTCRSASEKTGPEGVKGDVICEETLNNSKIDVGALIQGLLGRSLLRKLECMSVLIA